MRQVWPTREIPMTTEYVKNFNKTLKCEGVYLWTYESIDDGKSRITHSMKDVYNRKHLSSSLVYLSLDEFEDLFAEEQE